MLSTNLREVSQCLEKAPTRTFSLLRAPTSPATESYRRFVDSSSSGESAGGPGNVPPRPTQLRVHCPAQHPSISISNPLGCIPWPVPPPSWPRVMAAAVLLLHPAQPLHLHCDQHPGLGEPPADLPHQHAPLGQTQLPVLTVIWLLVNIINGWKTQNQKQWQITLRWWLRRNVF